MALPLDNPHMTRVEIDIREAKVHEFGVPHPSDEEQLEHDHMGEVLRGPYGIIERDYLRLRQEGRQPCGRRRWSDL
jgi:hypothetical protein